LGTYFKVCEVDVKVPEACTPKRAGERDFNCFFQLTQMIIGGKWKPKVLYYLGASDTLRFGELRDGIIGISEKVLIQQLRELEADGIVHREIYKQVPPKVEYSLTPMGKTLVPLMEQQFEWGRMYASHLTACACEEPLRPGEILEDLDERVAVED
jgi:DNA-binding HxlR family transcriptional regulator